MCIDENKIIKKINTIKKALINLNELAKLKPDEFLSDFKYYDSAKYNLQIAIEAMIDIGNHVISRFNYDPPKTYADTFEILGKNNLLPSDLVNTYKLMAKFYNRIVHFYDDINESEVYNIMQNNLSDFEKFVISIANFLKKPIN